MARTNKRAHLLRYLLVPIVVGALLPGTHPAQAQPETTEADTPPPSASSFPIPLSLTIRGGSSLGAYEAGYLYMMTEAIKRNEGTFDPQIVTGASAGTINAILTILALGSEREDDPQQSLYYQVWTRLGFNQLLDVNSPQTPPGALSSRNLMWHLADEIEKRWNDGLTEDFDWIVGASTTRLLPMDKEISSQLSIPTELASFVFRVEGRGPGKPPRLVNHLWKKPGLDQLLLPFEDDHHHNFETMMNVAFASCGIPVVFPPQEIDYCSVTVADPNGGGTEDGKTPMTCDPSITGPIDKIKTCVALDGETRKICDRTIVTDRFVDGGVVDNSPINLAYLLSLSKPIPEDLGLFRQQPLMVVPAEPEPHTLFLYLDPDNPVYPKKDSSRDPQAWTMESHRQIDRGLDLFGTLPKFLGGFLKSANAAELNALVDTNPDIREHVRLTNNYFQPIASVLGGKFGFLEREFLKFDFYLGMHDAQSYIENQVRSYLETLPGYVKDTPINFPGGTAAKPADGPSWHPYRCMRAVFDDEGDPKEACKAVELEADDQDDIPGTIGELSHPGPLRMRDFRILMQVAIDWLYTHCSLLEGDQMAERLEHNDQKLCKRAFDREQPVRVPWLDPAPKGDDWRQCIARKKARTPREKENTSCLCNNRRRNESEYDYVLRLFEEYEFRFRDLELSPGRAGRARAEIQETFWELLTAFADNYDLTNRDLGKTTNPDEEVNTSGDKLVLRGLGKPAVGFLSYVPPKNILYFVLGKGSNFAWSHTRTGWARFNWNLLELKGADTLTTDAKVMSATTALGLEWQIPWLSTAVIQPTVGMRVGYQVSTEGNFLRDSCDGEMGENTDRCSAPVIQWFASLALMSRLRLEGAIEYYPYLGEEVPLPPADHRWTFMLGIGVQFLPSWYPRSKYRFPKLSLAATD